MSILNIQPATRKGAHLLIQLFGGPQSGKTLSALKIARGIVGPSGKIGMLDTESGRARLYCDKIEGGFMVGELTPPYTPGRYRECVTEFIAAGVDILIVDSFSHVWEGTGGVLDQADQGEADGKKGLQKWLKPKMEYKKLVSFLLSTRLHVILCSRAKQPMAEVVNDKGKKELVPMPWQPIQDKSLKFEMTIVLPMTIDGHYETDRSRLKAPSDIAHIFTGAPVTIETGQQIAAWVAGGAPIDHETELLMMRADSAANDGTEALTAYSKTLTGAQKLKLRALDRNYASIAKAADEQLEQERLAKADEPTEGKTAEL